MVQVTFSIMSEKRSLFLQKTLSWKVPWCWSALSSKDQNPKVKLVLSSEGGIHRTEAYLLLACITTNGVQLLQLFPPYIKQILKMDRKPPCKFLFLSANYEKKHRGCDCLKYRHQTWNISHPQCQKSFWSHQPHTNHFKESITDPFPSNMIHGKAVSGFLQRN